jgi:replicative DNA helicase
VHYLPWPIKELESELEAEPGDFIVVGGRPPTGKTALTIQCAFHWARNGYKVGYFSLETNKAKVTDRLVSHAARISKSRIRKNELTDDDWQLFARVSSTRIVNAKLELVEAAGMSCTDIQAFTAMRGYDVIIIDYLQLIQEDGRSPVERVSQISIKLHTMAQNKKVTVVALSQLSRMDKQNPRYATMADLRESGQIEQDADMILLLNPKNVKDAVQGQNRVLRVEKNKEGGLSEIELEFEGHFQTFKKAPVTLDEHMGRRGCESPPPPEPSRWLPPAEDYDYVGGF